MEVSLKSLQSTYDDLHLTRRSRQEYLKQLEQILHMHRQIPVQSPPQLPVQLHLWT